MLVGDPMVADGYDGRLTPCPRCGYGDSVLGVPAAYAAARSTEVARRVARDPDAMLARRRGAQRAVAGALPIVGAEKLAMAPTGCFPAVGCGIVLFGVITVGGLTIYQFATDHNSGDSVLLVAAAAA